MINNSKDICELIKQLETPSGRARAVLALSKQYQVPEENVREAIATLEAAYDSNAAQGQNQRIESLLSAANLARKILWIEKAVDLTAKAGRKSAAAEMAEEFGLDKKAFALYKESSNTIYKAIGMAKKLELWDEYIGLCQKENEHADAINKCKELGRPREAELIFTKVFMCKSKYKSPSDLKEITELAEKTGFIEYAFGLCKEHKKDYAMAMIAAGTDQPRLAMEYFEKIEHFADAARQALLVKDGAFIVYIDKAIKLFLKEAEKLQKNLQYANSLAVLKEIPLTRDSQDIVFNKIFDCYVHLGQFEDGAKYFEENSNIPRALSLLEQAGLTGLAQCLAAKHGLANAVKEYTQKLGLNEGLAKIAMEEGNFDQAIVHYTAEIDKKKAANQYWPAAETALKVAALCEKHNQNGLATEFQKQARGFFALEAKKEEEQGYWDQAAKYAEKAGNIEKAKLYGQINALAKAYITP